jgi:hypothetical protein
MARFQLSLARRLDARDETGNLRQPGKDNRPGKRLDADHDHVPGSEQAEMVLVEARRDDTVRVAQPAAKSPRRAGRHRLHHVPAGQTYASAADFAVPKIAF